MELERAARDQDDRICISRKALEALLQQCHQVLQHIASGCDDSHTDNSSRELDSPEDSTDTYDITSCDTNTTKLYSLLKSKFECDDFLKKLENDQALLPQNMAEEGGSWDLVSKNDLWGGRDVEMEDYVLVQQEDIVEGISSFMAAYLLSLEQAKELTPSQLQEVLNKTFSIKKKKSKLRKAWDGSRVIYNVASWGATAVGIYQNPALLGAASTAFRTSCRVISNLL